MKVYELMELLGDMKAGAEVELCYELGSAKPKISELQDCDGAVLIILEGGGKCKPRK